MDKNGWIPVEERFPEKSGVYLVSDKWGNVRSSEFLAYPDPDEDFHGMFDAESHWDERGVPYNYGRVIAWMELPTPYEEGDRNMNNGKACAICSYIESNLYSDDEKTEAINAFLQMDTHNGISKIAMVVLLRWLFDKSNEKGIADGNGSWIPVDERRPDCDFVLVSDAKGNQHVARYDRYWKGFDVFRPEHSYPYPLLAWQPLPEPYNPA